MGPSVTAGDPGAWANGLLDRLQPIPSTFMVDGREMVAAAAVVLAPAPRDPSVLLIERGLRDDDPWSGHVAFPGGRREPSDASPLATAVRETFEEVGLRLGVDECLGALRPWSPANRPGLLVLPLVFELPRASPTGISNEATASFWADLGILAASSGRAVRATSRGEVEVPCFNLGGWVVWGFTYRILVELMALMDFELSP